MREILSVCLCALLIAPPALAEKKSQADKIRAKLVVIQAGAIVEVEQLNTVWKGRLGDLGAESFAVLVAGKDKVEWRQFRYEEVQNVRDLTRRGMRPQTRLLVLVLVVGGIIASVGLSSLAGVRWTS